MNLSAQDHQTLFTCEYDVGKTDYEGLYYLCAACCEEVRVCLPTFGLFTSALTMAWIKNYHAYEFRLN
jgi:ST7 protein